MLLDSDNKILEQFDSDTLLNDEILSRMGWTSSERGDGYVYWVNKLFMKGMLIKLSKGYLYSYNTWGSHCDTVGDLMRIIRDNPKLLN